MNYVIFDLEWNRVVKAVKKRCPDEIIQIGAVKYNDKMQCIGTFNRFISPVLYKKLDPTVKKLTGLSQELLIKEGVLFAKAIKDFRKFVGADSVLMSWGSQDALVLRKNCHYFNADAKLGFLTQFADVQRFATRALTNEKSGGNQLSVKMAADLSGIRYNEEKLHDALVDATISGMVFAKIFDKEKLKKYIVDASDIDFSFKDVHVTNPDDKMVDKQIFKIRCPICGRFTRRKTGWSLSGNKFVSSQVCRKCKNQFLCSIEILKAYGDVMKYKKRIRLMKPEKNENSERKKER